jgi:hypothetical protein
LSSRGKACSATMRLNSMRTASVAESPDVAPSQAAKRGARFAAPKRSRTACTTGVQMAPPG